MMVASDGWEGILLGRWCIVDVSQEFFFENLVNWSVKYNVYHDEIHPAGGVWNLNNVVNTSVKHHVMDQIIWFWG